MAFLERWYCRQRVGHVGLIRTLAALPNAQITGATPQVNGCGFCLLYHFHGLHIISRGVTRAAELMLRSRYLFGVP